MNIVLGQKWRKQSPPYEVVHSLPSQEMYIHADFEKRNEIFVTLTNTFWLLSLISYAFSYIDFFSPMVSIISSVKSVSSTSENSPNSSAYTFLIAFHNHTIHQLKVYNSVSFSIFTELYNHYHNKFRTFSSPAKKLPVHIAVISPMTSSPRQLIIYLLSVWFCLFLTFPKNEFIQYIDLCDWLPSFSILFLSSVHVVPCISTLFISIAA